MHHSAEVLSPLTNFRVHPLDTLVFYNILALVMGGTGGLVNYWLGRATPHFTIANSNVLTLVFFFLIGHLQHSHFWIAFTGVWGRLFLSPAHHQIHHSANPIHFDKNLGSCLGIWDWLFGTLYVPGKTREKLSFGVEPKSPVAHTVRGGLIAPLCDAFATSGHCSGRGGPLPPLRRAAQSRPIGLASIALSASRQGIARRKQVRFASVRACPPVVEIRYLQVVLACPLFPREGAPVVPEGTAPRMRMGQ